MLVRNITRAPMLAYSLSTSAAVGRPNLVTSRMSLLPTPSSSGAAALIYRCHVRHFAANPQVSTSHASSSISSANTNDSNQQQSTQQQQQQQKQQKQQQQEERGESSSSSSSSTSFFKSDSWTKLVGTVGAIFNWSIPLAGITHMMSTKDPATTIDPIMTTSLAVYSLLFMRWSIAISPANYPLLMCHIANEIVQATQLVRYAMAEKKPQSNNGAKKSIIKEQPIID